MTLTVKSAVVLVCWASDRRPFEIIAHIRNGIYGNIIYKHRFGIEVLRCAVRQRTVHKSREPIKVRIVFDLIYAVFQFGRFVTAATGAHAVHIIMLFLNNIDYNIVRACAAVFR